eukprot:CAMPEP_0176069584 /NCGR_PEP_ID=MMETSP0120_2-20121206/34744_1 /TAXON_ID=160619 /ORGANISM="Kryptoperidinium foliaceum, Strain CCMP 1326" /LENGTH=147 /DNA_ID=CAMNT_0017403221 /DNA_START=9 /DNA_END=448 /DNA_ORIENTATION=+
MSTCCATWTIAAEARLPQDGSEQIHMPNACAACACAHPVAVAACRDPDRSRGRTRLRGGDDRIPPGAPAPPLPDSTLLSLASPSLTTSAFVDQSGIARIEALAAASNALARDAPRDLQAAPCISAQPRKHTAYADNFGEYNKVRPIK